MRLIVSIGVSTFGEKPDEVGPGHLKELLEHALGIVPADVVADTPLFLLATAGMRLLPESQRTELLSHICSYAQSQTGFQISDCDLNIQVLPGQTEGLYGWIAVNYLLGGFDFPAEHGNEKDHHTYGFLDMGGASAQIAFAPNWTETARHAEDLKLLRMRKLNGAAAEYKVFVTSWLGFGVNEARRRYVEALLKATGKSDAKELHDPCLPTDLAFTTKGDVFLPGPKTVDGKIPYLIGTGQFDRCLNKTYPLLEKDAICEDEPCLLNGVHVPAIDFGVNHFVGISEYWHTTHEIFDKGHDEEMVYDLTTFQRRVSDFCSMDWKDIQKGIEDHSWGKKLTSQRAAEVCFKASWLINILHEGIGVPRIGLENSPGGEHNRTKEVDNSSKEKYFTNSFQAVNKIGDTEVSWTLGKMVLFASSQIPPLSDKSPVGFGSNIPSGIPSDFQYAGSSLSTVTPTPKNSTTLSTSHSDLQPAEDWHDTPFAGRSPRRIPGFLLFLLILCLATFLLCGRERRKTLCRKLQLFRPSSSSHPHHHPRSRKRKIYSSIIKVPSFFRAPTLARGAYEHVLEDGRSPPDRFELGSVEPYRDDNDDDDSEGEAGDNEYSDDSGGSGSSWTGKSSGWATPRLVGGLSSSSSAAGVKGGGGGGAEYFDKNNPIIGGAAAVGGDGFGLGLGILGRSGLVGRAESRDRLASNNNIMMMGVPPGSETAGRRSRKVSPVRGRGMMDFE